LVLATIAGLAMWGGIGTGNGWLIASSLLLLIVSGGTEGGQRFLFVSMKLLMVSMGLFIVVLVIGTAALFILALTGTLKP
jgi:hypothetical protein